MKIIFGKPYGFTNQGQRDKQEDSMYPLPENLSESFSFCMVCDGVGGSEDGEVASQTVCMAFAEYYKQYGLTDAAIFVKDALDYAYKQIDSLAIPYIHHQMATTMTFLAPDKKGVLIAHLGDSRVYQFRPSSLIDPVPFITKDHSIVADLIEIGEITPQEAETDKRRHIITRCIQAGGGHYDPTLNYITDVQAGDYFFLCSDGILEQATKDRLVEIISRDTDDVSKIDAIYKLCENKTSDNNTCILVPVMEVMGDDEKSALELKQPKQKLSQYERFIRYIKEFTF